MQGSIALVIFLLMNCMVGMSAFWLLKIFKLKSKIDCLLTFAVLYYSQIIITELILGILGKLYLNYLVLLNAVFFLIIWLTLRKTPVYIPKAPLWDKDAKTNKVILFMFSFIFGFAMVKLLINLVNPPFGWDSLNYHFTFPVEWIKHANLVNPITISCDPSPPYYPIGGSLIYLWLILPFKDVLIADLGQVLFFILGFLAVFSIAKKFDLSDKLSFLSAGLFTLIPNYFKQLEIAYVDVMVSSFFLIALNYLLLLKEKLSIRNTVLFALAIGLLISVKTLALLYSVLLLLPFLYMIKSAGLKKIILLSFVSIASILLIGGFSYIRNFIQTNNPMYPLDFKLFGKVIFSGVEAKEMYAVHFKPQDYSISKILFHEGFGMQGLLLILPGMLFSLPITLLKRKKPRPMFIYAMMLPLLLFLIWRFIIPVLSTRFLYPLFGIGVILGFYTAKILNLNERAIGFFAIICVIVSCVELSGHLELILSIVSSSILFSLFIFKKSFLRMYAIVKKPLFIVSFVLLLIVLFPLLQNNYLKYEYSRYVKNSPFWKDAAKAWQWLNENTKDDNIAYIGRPIPFPLYGTNFKNNVYYVSINKTEPAKLHYFPHSCYRWGYDFMSLHKNLRKKGNYREKANYGDWFNNLKTKNIDYLFIYSLHQTKDIIFPIEDVWTGQHPEVFSLVFRNETIHIYKLCI